MKPAELPGLTISRYFAALLVALLHYAEYGLREAPQWLRNVVASGYMGVPFFFVLSGFVLVYASRDARLDAGQFWIRRVARIYPVYLLAWLLYGSIVVGLRDSSLHTLAFTTIYGGLSALLAQAWIPGAAEKWNAPGWSLSCEAFFYLIFPFVVPRLRSARTSALAVLLLGLAVWSVWRVELSYAFTRAPAFAGTPFQTSIGTYLGQLPAVAACLFLLGVVTGLLFERGCRLDARWCWPLSLALFVMMASDVQASHAGILRDAWITLLMPCLIVALAAVTLRDSPLKSLGMTLGRGSYGMYILQFPVWSLLWMIVDGDGKVEKELHVALAFIAALSGLCCLIYVYFERPAERLVKEAARDRLARSRASVSARPGQRQ